MFNYFFSYKRCFRTRKVYKSHCLKAFLLENRILLFQELFGAIGTLCSARLVNIGTAECVYENAEDAFAAYTKYHTRNLDGKLVFSQMIYLNLMVADVLMQHMAKVDTTFSVCSVLGLIPGPNLVPRLLVTFSPNW